MAMRSLLSPHPPDRVTHARIPMLDNGRTEVVGRMPARIKTPCMQASKQHAAFDLCNWKVDIPLQRGAAAASGAIHHVGPLADRGLIQPHVLDSGVYGPGAANGHS